MLELAIGWAGRDDACYEDSLTIFRKVECAAHCRVEEGEWRDSDVHVVVIVAVFDIAKKAIYDRGGDDVADVVSLCVTLEGDTDDFAVLDNWASGVAGVNGGINLDDEVLVCT